MGYEDRSTGWFLAQFKPNSHHIAERNLARQGFETFLPLQEETRRTRRKFTTHLRPLFPGYMFVALDMLQGHWRKVNSTYGILRLVIHRKIPKPLPDELINQLMIRCDQEGRLIPPKEFASGDRVLLTKGPFTNFIAKIESVDPDRRVWILLDIIGRETRVAIDADHVRAVCTPGKTKDQSVHYEPAFMPSRMHEKT